MFKFEELRGAQIEITNKCQAACPMCARNIHGGIENPLLKINEWSLADFKAIFNIEILKQLSYINFCGDFGEPILNNDLIDMCRYSTETNPNIEIHIHTNGSARTTKWWTDLYTALPTKHKVVFALDGLADTHHIYRIGTFFDKIIENARAFIDAGGTAEWNYIRFKHNEHQVGIAEQLAKDLGFKKFIVKDSKRFSNSFPVVNAKGEIEYHIEQPTNSIVKFVGKLDVEYHNKWKDADQISCFVQKDKEIYIDAHYTALPCCIISAFLYMNYDSKILKDHDISIENHVNEVAVDVQKQVWNIVDELGGTNVLKRGIKDLISSEVWQTLWQRKWQNKESSACIIMCSPCSPYISIEDQKTKQIRFDNNV
jgi:hypothetical protein